MERKKFPTKQKSKTGPKRIFSEQDLRAIEFLSKLGATNTQFANFFNVSVSTIEYWVKNYSEYRDAVKRGGIEADMKVVQSLYKRAIGYSYIEEEFTAIESEGVKFSLKEMQLVRRTKKVLPPDIKAIIHWLRIRQREIWSVVPEMLHRHTGKVDHLHRRLQDIPIQELSPEAQKVLFEITQKQLSASSHEN